MSEVTTMTGPRTFLPCAAPRPKSTAATTCARVFLCGLSLALGATTASAEEPSVDEMVCALNPKCATPFVDHRLRGISAPPSARPAGSFDRTVNFAFDSAELTADARKELDEVAKALSHPDVANFDIIISGHTDDVGSAEYNQKLSERRASAARQYLIAQHGLNAGRLVAKGFGKSQLLLPTEPTNELNRRVSFQNSSYVPSSVPAAGAAAPAPPAAKGDGL
jgi:outer membrane protein OmpA-like peptidoglycan-associated protein